MYVYVYGYRVLAVARRENGEQVLKKESVGLCYILYIFCCMKICIYVYIYIYIYMYVDLYVDHVFVAARRENGELVSKK